MRITINKHIFKHNIILVLFGISRLFISLSSLIIIPSFVKQWSVNARYDMMRPLAGATLGIIGIAIFVFAWRSIFKSHGKRWFVDLAKVIGLYLGSILLAGLLVGALGQALSKSIDIDLVERVQDCLNTVFHCIIRTVDTGLAVSILYNNALRDNKREVLLALVLATVLSAISYITGLILPFGVGSAVTIVLDAAIYMFFIIYFVSRFKNEKGS